jgi:pimeloyl-ACP methyl ester carboxylesterase
MAQRGAVAVLATLAALAAGFGVGAIWALKGIWPIPQLLQFKLQYITPQNYLVIEEHGRVPAGPSFTNDVVVSRVSNRYRGMYEDLPAQYWPKTDACPEFHHFLFEEIAAERSCNRLTYRGQQLTSFSVLLRHSGGVTARRALLIYNHGHNGLPIRSETYARVFLKRMFDAGYDILLVTMPLVGFNEPSKPARLNSIDGEAVTGNLPQLGHAVFETLDVGDSSYLRFFIDDAVFFVSVTAKQYERVVYAGHSGGAWTGVYVCSALRDIIARCFLSSGVMPLHIRVSDGHRSFGDAEQISGQINRNFPLYDEIAHAVSKIKLSFYYNTNDPCCFNGAMPEKFSKELSERKIPVGFHIGRSDEHAFDPDVVYDFFIGP